MSATISRMINSMPSVEGSRMFVRSHITSLTNIRQLSTEEMIKGKNLTHRYAPIVQNYAQDKSNVSASNPWLRPEVGKVKLNVDGSFLQHDNVAGAGMLL